MFQLGRDSNGELSNTRIKTLLLDYGRMQWGDKAAFVGNRSCSSPEMTLHVLKVKFIAAL